MKKLVAERDLEIEVMKEIAAKNGERAGSPFRSGVATGGGCRAAGLRAARGRPIGIALSLTEGGEGRTGACPDERLAAQYPRYGYRRVQIFLAVTGTR